MTEEERQFWDTIAIARETIDSNREFLIYIGSEKRDEA